MKIPVSTESAPSAIGPYSQGIKNQGTLIYDVKGKINDFSDQSL